ncbi:MAG: DUF3467 domain-containing protein [Elusimicrobia bacterium]|nr:DUF3467 domain-containing protein [Candidatus Obscuribacterium magneticum]
MPDQPKQPQQLQVEIDDVTAQGVYCNLAFLTHSEQEFIMDFMFLSPQQPKAKVRSRVITSPKHAKRFLAALMDNIQKYEARFGAIPLDTSPPPPPPGLYN